MEADVTILSKNAAHAERAQAWTAENTQAARWISATLRRAAEVLKERRMRREMLREFSRLSDRDLEDIGVNRTDFPGPMRFGGWPWR